VRSLKPESHAPASPAQIKAAIAVETVKILRTSGFIRRTIDQFLYFKNGVVAPTTCSTR
jgi:hypothetical protein